jgi:hypothetical protein
MGSEDRDRDRGEKMKRRTGETGYRLQAKGKTRNGRPEVYGERCEPIFLPRDKGA